MEERFGKYLRLFGSIFFVLIGFLLTIVALLLALRFIFGLLTYVSWVTYAYIVLILLIPAGLFIPSFIIYAKRTARHPHKGARIISYLLFATALMAWLIFLTWDIIIFYKHAYTAIGMYHSYDMIFLSLNVACLFIVGIIQAFTSSKEKDWLENNLRAGDTLDTE